jgi:hypothetical protein
MTPLLGADLELHRDGKSVCLAQGATMATHTVKECAALFRRAVGGLTVLILALISTNGPGQEEGKQAEQLGLKLRPSTEERT